MKRFVIMTVSMSMLVGCTMRGGKPYPGQVVDCTDFRDGDKWTWHSENLTIRQGIGTSSTVSGKADDGREITADAANQFIKCVKRQ